MSRKRRGNGEGTIYKRKDGRYEARYTVLTASGPKRKALYGKTRAEAAAKLTKAMADRDGGLAFDDENLTLEAYLTRWLNGSVRGSVRQRTLENYEYVVRVHLVPTLGRVKLKALTPAHVQALYREKLDSGLSPRTVQLIHTTLHRALKQAVRWGLVPRNVTEAVDAPRPTRKEVQALTPEQVRTFLEAARGDRLEALYVLALSTGLRQGELLGLRWEDVDLERGLVRIRQQLTRTRNGLTFSQPKTDKSRRSVRLTPAATEALAHHRKRQLEERSKMEGLWHDTGLVFTTTRGTPLDVSNLTYKSFRQLLERAGLPRIKFHALRHTFATLMLSGNVNPKIVQEILGHARIGETMDTYSHYMPDMQEEAIGKLGKLLT